jgi:hypothetical protein
MWERYECLQSSALVKGKVGNMSVRVVVYTHVSETAPRVAEHGRILGSSMHVSRQSALLLSKNVVPQETELSIDVSLNLIRDEVWLI